MKKALIAGAASTIALAAMPMAGVFAAPVDITTTEYPTVTDTVTATVASSCKLETTATLISGQTNQFEATYAVAKGDNNPTTTLSNDQTGTATGSTMNIKCNAGNGWMVKISGVDPDGEGAATATQMSPNTTGSTPISTATEGTNSYWNVALAAAQGQSQAAGIAWGTGFTAGAAHVVPEGDTLAVYAEHATDMNDGITITPTYTVYIGKTQGAGTYTGKVKYSIISPYAN